MKEENYIAYDASCGDSESFETFDEAVNWLKDGEDDGISEEMVNGQNYIAKVTHRSVYIETDNKKNHPPGEWPHDDEFDSVGTISYQPVEELTEPK